MTKLTKSKKQKDKSLRIHWEELDQLLKEFSVEQAIDEQRKRKLHKLFDPFEDEDKDLVIEQAAYDWEPFDDKGLVIEQTLKETYDKKVDEEAPEDKNESKQRDLPDGWKNLGDQCE